MTLMTKAMKTSNHVILWIEYTASLDWELTVTQEWISNKSHGLTSGFFNEILW